MVNVNIAIIFFMLDWTNSDTRIPKPLLNINLKNYMQQYNKSKVV